MFPLVETIKILGGTAHNLDLHQSRMDSSYEKLYGSKNIFELNEIIDIPIGYKKDKVKLRFLYNQHSFKAGYSDYSPKPLKTLQCVYDNEISYSLKYTDRSKINNLLLQKSDCDDILIVKNGFITDSSYTNIVFFDGNNWVTPVTPLLYGTAREKLIRIGKIKTEFIKIEDLNRFSHFKLINAMLDFEEQDKIDINNIYI